MVCVLSLCAVDHAHMCSVLLAIQQICSQFSNHSDSCVNCYSRLQRLITHYSQWDTPQGLTLVNHYMSTLINGMVCSHTMIIKSQHSNTIRVLHSYTNKLQIDYIANIANYNFMYN